MNRLRHIFVWLSRVTHSRGFGIQSPNDYWIERHVINETLPYYSYATMGQDDDWLTQKLGRLYFRLANWRQPSLICSDRYQEYLHAGCRTARILPPPLPAGATVEMARIDTCGANREQLLRLLRATDDHSLLILENIQRNRELWHEVLADERVRITFDLYDCGIVLFDKKRAKTNYIINF